MRYFLSFLLLLTPIINACSDAGAGEEPVKVTQKEPVKSEPCKCQPAKLSDVKWVYGTLCPKGQLSQGHGVNPQGKVVTGCYSLVSGSGCKVDEVKE